MPKISFTKVESIWTERLRLIMIERLSELAVLVTLIRDPEAKIPPKTIEKIIKRFQSELKKIKEKDPKLYQNLQLNSEEETRFLGDLASLNQEEWNRLMVLKERIGELRKELAGDKLPKKEDEEQVEKERIKHINKRFNIQDGWLPLQ